MPVSSALQSLLFIFCGTCAQVNKIIRKAVVPSYMSDKELDDHVVIHTSDHCSVMTASAKLSIRTFRGDPPHACALAIKNMLNASGLKPELMLLRSILAKKNSLKTRRLMDAFGIPRSKFDPPTTRWATWTTILSTIADDKYLARIQQLLAYMLSEMKSVGVRAKKKTAPVQATPAIEDDDWGENDDDDDDEQEDLPAAGAAVSSETASKQEKLKRDLLTAQEALQDPAVLCRVRVALIMTQKVKDANKQMQTSALDKETLRRLSDILKHFKQLEVPTTRATLLDPAKQFLKDARDPTKGNRPHALVALVVHEEDGLVRVPNLDAIGLPTFTQLEGSTATEKAKVDAEVWKVQLDHAVLVHNAGTEMYNKWIAPLILSAERRHAANLFSVFPVNDFRALSDNVPDAWPEAASSDAPGDAGAVAGAGASAGAVAAKASDKYFTWTPAAAPVEDDDDFVIEYSPEVKAALQYEEYFHASSSLTESDKADPTSYWIGKREKWPVLSELMLFWLATPVSTSVIERSFSFQTMIDSDTRRRCLQPGHLRANLLAHIHKSLFVERAKVLCA